MEHPTWLGPLLIIAIVITLIAVGLSFFNYYVIFHGIINDDLRIPLSIGISVVEVVCFISICVGICLIGFCCVCLAEFIKRRNLRMRDQANRELRLRNGVKDP
jgi:ABC-type uncharacterized transport system permease subunit